MAANEIMGLDYDDFKKAVSGRAAALRSRTILQPAGGEGDKVFPPTYAGAVYATEKRRRKDSDEPVECVLLNSVQAEANRMEEALQLACDEGRLSIPIIEVDFSDGDLLTEIGKITSLQVPHRIADAIMRDSLLNGKPFRKSDLGKWLDQVSINNATPIYQLCPTALVFGMWDSTGPKGGLGAKFQRALVSEIVGIDAVYGVKTSSRIDPLQIMLGAGPLYKSAKGDGIGWTLDEKQAAKDKKGPLKLGKDGKPAEANHGNVTPSLSIDRETGRPIAGGVTIASAEQVTVISMPALRRLQFPLEGKKADATVNDAGRTVLAALGLCAAVLASERGLDLRSRCLLWPTEPISWEILGRPGEQPTKFSIDGDAAIQLLNRAVADAETAGLKWQREPLKLKPDPELVALLKKSQELAPATGSELEGVD